MRGSVVLLGALFLLGLFGCDGGSSVSSTCTSACSTLNGSWALVDTVYGTATITDIFTFHGTGAFDWVEYDLSGSVPDTTRSNGNWVASGSQLTTTDATGLKTTWIYSIAGSTLRLIDTGFGYSDTAFYTRQ